MQGANFHLLARHLAQSEFPGYEIAEHPGGLLASGNGGLWAAVWQTQGIENSEDWVMQLAESSEADGLEWKGVLALCQPQDEAAPGLSQLAAALESFGYNRRRGLEGGAPEMVQVLGKSEHPKPVSGLECSIGEAEEASAMLDAAAGQQDALTNARLHLPAVPEGAKLILARSGGEVSGFAVLGGTELVGRVYGVWVEPASRGKGIGRALVSQAMKNSGEAGRIVLSAWTQRPGQLRYFFNKSGFEDTLSAQYWTA